MSRKRFIFPGKYKKKLPDKDILFPTKDIFLSETLLSIPGVSVEGLSGIRWKPRYNAGKHQNNPGGL